MMQFICNVVVFPWIRGRQPISKVSLQFITCQMILALPIRDANLENILTFRFVLVAR